MAIINQEMEQMLNQAMWVFATSNEQGEPNAVPIHFKKVMNDTTLLLVDNFMNKSKANLISNPRVSISVWTAHEGFQFKGSARYMTEGPMYDEGAALIPPNFFPDGHCSKGVVIVDVDAIYTTTPGPRAGTKIS